MRDIVWTDVSDVDKWNFAGGVITATVFGIGENLPDECVSNIMGIVDDAWNVAWMTYTYFFIEETAETAYAIFLYTLDLFNNAIDVWCFDVVEQWQNTVWHAHFEGYEEEETLTASNRLQNPTLRD